MANGSSTSGWLSAFSRRGFLQSLAASGAVLVTGRRGHADDVDYAQGVVFEDRNGSGRRDADDPPIAGVRVSNGREVTVTDDQGRWRLPLEEGRTVFFVIKPRGYRTPVTRHNLPRFHHVHDPAGSPELRYAGLEPSGDLPESIDFPLLRQEEPEQFTALMCGDPQPRNAREVGYLAQTAVPDLKREEAAFGVSLGDIMFDDLDLFEPLNQAFRHIGRPWYNVLGNHDLNFDTDGDDHANDTFLRIYGPTYYAFEYGPVHFLVLNNVQWMGQDPDNPGATGNYRGYIGQRQLEFIRNELEHVPKDKLTVVIVHIPIHSVDNPNGERANTVDRHELYRLIEDRPNLVSFSAHRHWHGHFFIGEEDGWRGDQPLHHIVMGTLCGSWFRGAPDTRGVPHAMMMDGTPRGYSVFRFDGNSYTDRYRCIGKHPDTQMHIELPNLVEHGELSDTQVYVNVFNGSERSKVRMRLDGEGEWHELEQRIEPDPRYLRVHEQDRAGDLDGPYIPMARPYDCYHLWAGQLPADLAEGSHLVEIEAEDMHGQIARGSRPLRVVG